MDDKKKKGLIVSYFLSRCDKEGYRALGYSSFTEVYNKTAALLNENPNNIKNMRDEFDPYFDNNRVGWHQRPLRSLRQTIFDKFKGVNDSELTNIVKTILNGGLVEGLDDLLSSMEDEDKMFQNLNILIKGIREKFLDSFVPEDLQLTDEFKQAYGIYLRTVGQNVEFEKTTAIITTSGNLKIYAPNQWFVIASYVVDLVRELIKYRKACDKIILNLCHNAADKKNYIKKMKENAADDDKENFLILAKAYLKEENIMEQNIDIFADYLLQFVSNYSWWSGSKTIDRGDYHVSPVLNVLQLVHVSQSYVADIAYILANELTLTTDVKYVSEDDKKVSEATIKSVDMSEIMKMPRMTGGHNLILYGAPGTGKSRKLEDMFKTAPLTRRVVFHPEYSYFDFVGTYKPVPVYKKDETELFNTEGQLFDKGEPFIDYRFVPGPFVQVLMEAWNDPTNMHTILIEEINRANTAAVFGEIFQLLDRNKDGSGEYCYEPAVELKSYLIGQGYDCFIRKGLALPSNMNIVATMNSADQGVNIIDSAFKRRWNYMYMRIDIKSALHRMIPITYAGKEVKWGYFITAINNKLKALKINEDKLIGPYFIKPDELNNRYAMDKLLLYLWDDVLRHKREHSFAGSIRCFSDLSDNFSTIDVLGICDFIEGLSPLEIGIEDEDNLMFVDDEEEKEENGEIEDTGVNNKLL